MFQMREVGRKIAARRKEKNMTQMELADIMGVSFQAVSNWERGNSMPDIAKLPELAVWLDISIDELLTDGKPMELVRSILDGRAEEYIKEESISTDTVAQVAPILKPDQTESLLEAALNNNPDKVEFIDLVSLAPFVSGEFLNLWVKKAANIDSIRDLCALAPFLPEETLDHLVDKLVDADINIRSLTSLAPFLSEHALDKLVSVSLHDANVDDIAGLAPFLSENALNAAVERLTEANISVRSLVALAPFLSEQALDKLASHSLDEVNSKDLTALAPFLSKRTLERCAEKLIAKHGLKGIREIAPFL